MAADACDPLTEHKLAEIHGHLRFLYGEQAASVWQRLKARLDRFREAHPALRNASAAQRQLAESDVVLITYGDQVKEPGKRPLQTLCEVLEAYGRGVISGVHLLPFFPYSSDDGFSVIDYARVNPDLGTWEDVARLGVHFRLMFDAVVNHISRHSDWFQSFLHGDAQVEGFFITVPEGIDLSEVVRPRTLPLLTRVQTPRGERLVWTTFSDDQIDLNYAHPEVLLRIVDVLLLYVSQGAGMIRLDAIAYVWKRVGTSCIHLPETHRLVQLFRSILDVVAPGVIIITETNVPHQENISYWGDGTNEAQMVYQFPLPPLVLHTIATGDATKLTAWAGELEPPSEQATFFNFLASHDGIGVRPVEGILTPQEVQALVDRTQRHGGYVSYKTNQDGTRSAYELNISYFDALSDPQAAEPLARQVDRFAAAHAIMVALQGVPGIYVHSLFGSRSWRAGVEETGRYRTINRQKLARAELEAELSDPGSLRHLVFGTLKQMLQARRGHPAFHPNGRQRILQVDPGIFALTRTAPHGDGRLLCLHNVSDKVRPLRIAGDEVPWKGVRAARDILSGKTFPMTSGTLELDIAPYQVIWLEGV